MTIINQVKSLGRARLNHLIWIVLIYIADFDYKGGELNEELHGGLVLFWSIRNPDYPEKILRTSHAVTSLEFSKLQPMILAVGLINGDVAVYDVKREVNWNKPIHSRYYVRF